MKLAPSEQNIEMLNQVSVMLTNTKQQLVEESINLLTRLQLCMDNLTAGDAQSLKETIQRIVNDVKQNSIIMQEMSSEATTLANTLFSELHASFVTDSLCIGELTHINSNSETASIRAAQAALQIVRGWLDRKEINPKYQPFTPYGSNCGSCAFALWLRLTGRNPTAMAGINNIAPRDADMERLTGLQCKYMQPNEIADHLKHLGPGAHLIVGINRYNNSGHWFNVFYDGIEIKTLDGQTGQIYDWPHDYGNISEWCAMI